MWICQITLSFEYRFDRQIVKNIRNKWLGTAGWKNLNFWNCHYTFAKAPWRVFVVVLNHCFLKKNKHKYLLWKFATPFGIAKVLRNFVQKKKKNIKLEIFWNLWSGTNLWESEMTTYCRARRLLSVSWYNFWKALVNIRLSWFFNIILRNWVETVPPRDPMWNGPFLEIVVP